VRPAAPETIETALLWRGQGAGVALATVTRTWGSSPAPAGSQMAIAADGRFAGSVSGGCIEAAVIDAAVRVIATGTPALLSFGVTEERAWEVGLACGGQVEVFVEALE
jgi:xanthine/CO dehydrogenase XdhC/CoxF family maturation factor